MLKELMEMTRALAVMSGDLDSILAVKAVMEQGIDVTGVCFKSAFFSYESAAKESEKLNIELKIIDITDEHFSLVKNCVNNKDVDNLCINCNSMKLSYAIRILKDVGADFLVLSDNINSNVGNESRKNGYFNAYDDKKNIETLVLRPLHAKYMAPTTVEKSGIVDREKLLRFCESLDKTRIEVSRELGFENFINYEDKCKLLHPLFSSRLKELFTYNKNCTVNDSESIK
jgi:tRNA-uridine 2-sulfurtransferase